MAALASISAGHMVPARINMAAPSSISATSSSCKRRRRRCPASQVAAITPATKASNRPAAGSASAGAVASPTASRVELPLMKLMKYPALAMNPNASMKPASAASATASHWSRAG